MNNLAIQAAHLSKQYRIGSTVRHDTLRDHLTDSLKSLFRRGGRQADHDTIWALRDISFEIKWGEIVGIIGRNGAGKSTLLKILSRITEPTGGRAEIYGRVGSLLEVGTGFHPELTGRENIALNGAILGMRKAEIERKFDQIVSFAEVEKFIDTPVKHYSSGMYMRLAFAVAAHLDPDILLIDEVLSVGDLAFQRKCMEYAKGFRERNATVLFVSHNMFAVTAMCDRVIYIADGKVRLDGSPEEVTELYEKENQLNALSGNQHANGPAQYPIKITQVGLFDEDRYPRRVFDYGERMRIRLAFEASQQIVNPNFVVAVIRSDNVACCNYSSVADRIVIPSVVGKGSIELLTPPLSLVSELYTIHILVWDAEFQRRYCVQQTGVTFHVRHQLFSPHFGVFHEPAEWVWHSDETECSHTNLELEVEHS